MTATALEPTYRAEIEGDVVGQVAVGANVIQIGHISGGKVEIYQGSPPRRRPAPQERPRNFPNLLGREQEVTLISNALSAAEVVEIAGRPGIGKTSLVRHLAYQVPPLNDGVIHRAPGNRPLEDVLQLLYDAFYTSDMPIKRRYGELVSDLNGIQALIYLDDLHLSRDDAGRLLDALPAATVLMVSEERRLYGDAGRSLALRGLPPEAGMALLEQELGRPPAGEEREAAQELVQMLAGNPLDILRAAAEAREEGLSLAQMASGMQTGNPSQMLAGEMVAKLTGQEQKIVAALAAVGDVPLHEDHLNAISPSLSAELEQLLANGAIQAHSPEYSLAGNLGDAIPEDWLPTWREWLLNHFVGWATQHRNEPELLMRDAPAMMHSLEWAVDTGRWPQAMALMEAMEPAMALDRQWAANRQILSWAYEAARLMGNEAAEAWALHQQGTYALGLGDQEFARTALERALSIRERLGDRLGAALTRHNLGFLPGPPPPPSQPEPEPTPGKSSSMLRPLLVGAGLLAGIAVIFLGLLIVINNRPPPDAPPVVASATPTPPDLVVARWTATGDPFQNEQATGRLAANNPFLLPVALAVQNEGDTDAGPFFVSVHTTRGACDELLPFVAGGQQETPFPEIDGIPANDGIVIEGVVGLLGAGPGTSCELVAVVDSTAPDPGLPREGRVVELDEGNNESGRITVTIPEIVQDTPPVVEIRSPKEGALFGFETFDEERNQWFVVIPMFAVAFDEEDGEIPAGNIRWETNRDDLQDPFLGRGNGLEVALYGSVERCASENHLITVTVIDSSGNEVQASVPVQLTTIC